MSAGIFGYDAGGRDVTTMTFNSRLAPDQIVEEVKKFPDREVISVYLGPNSTIIVSELKPITNLETGGVDG